MLPQRGRIFGSNPEQHTQPARMPLKAGIGVSVSYEPEGDGLAALFGPSALGSVVARFRELPTTMCEYSIASSQ